MTNACGENVPTEICHPSCHTAESGLQKALFTLNKDQTDARHANVTTHSLATAFLDADVSSLRVYQAAACLREGQVKEIVQFLTFLGPNAAPVALRMLTIMNGLQGNWELTLQFLEQQSQAAFSAFDQRVVSLIAFLGGRKAFPLFDWSPVIERAVRDDDMEAKWSLSALSERRWKGPKESALRVFDWEPEREHAENPSLWRELQWASYARSVCLSIDVGCSSSSACDSDTASTSLPHSNGVFESLPSEIGAAAPHYLRVCGTMLRRRSLKCRTPMSHATADNTPEVRLPKRTDRSAVVTPTVHRVIRQMAVYIAYGVPFVLEGPVGCGKTTLISLLARETMYDDERPPHETDIPGITFIQMDSTMNEQDGESFSSLVGGIVPLPEGGGFRWRPGPIGLAVERGEWLVFENVGKATIRMSSAVPVMLQLAKARPGDVIDAPGRGDPLVVGRGFRCIATRTVSVHARDDAWEPPGTWNAWYRVSMKGFSRDETVDILSTRFHNVKDCVPRVVDAIEKISKYTQEHRGPLFRDPTVREAVRVCLRLTTTRRETGNLTAENAFLETMEVLASWCTNDTHINCFVETIASCWSLPVQIGYDLYFRHRPAILLDTAFAKVGRASVARESRSLPRGISSLSMTSHTLRLLERVMRCLQVEENVLLTGETGSGKTSVIQELASLMDKKLVIVNLSRQTELSDLVGGFRPIERAAAVSQLAKRFEAVFCECLSRQKNSRFLDALQTASRISGQHHRALRLMKGAMAALPRQSRRSNPQIGKQWDAITVDLDRLAPSPPPSPYVNAAQGVERVPQRKESGEPSRKRPRVALPPLDPVESKHHASQPGDVSPKEVKRRVDFEFSEGVMVQAMREGSWILLDEINLAPPELLERLVSVVDRGQVTLSNEEGDVVSQGKGFALFGAMNPPTDVGKRALPSVLRSRFSEFHVSDMIDQEDLVDLTMHRFFRTRSKEKLLGKASHEASIAHDVAKFYLKCYSLAREGRVEDTTGRPIRFSLRTFSRMLDFAAGLKAFIKSGLTGLRRALFEGALVAFATQLPRTSKSLVMELAASGILQKTRGSSAALRRLSDLVAIPSNFARFVRMVQGFPIEAQSTKVELVSEHNGRFVVSPAVGETLSNVSRALLLGAPQLPILLQGPTAAGKTSLVAHLASITGHKLIRINNHEHTEISEYIGGYVASPDGSLAFSEGPLVRAARNGDWVLLDELNLAPPDVLESLNRLLDDNREIFIPETAEVVKAARSFRLFATQNPPGLYGGRKELSRAFRSRFVEVQVDELPDDDLLLILQRRSSIPESFAQKMIAVMRELQMRRRSTDLFAGKDGYATARDLFRWASRQPRSKEELAIHGFLLLGERAREPEDREVVRNILTQTIGNKADVLLDEQLYFLPYSEVATTAALDCLDFSLQNLSLSRSTLLEALRSCDIVSTPSMRRMLFLVVHALANAEPVLLVGETGGGKTSCCSAICAAMSKTLRTVNCHRHTEASDFLGSFRPVRKRAVDSPLFEWVDGPLVQAMKEGSAFLIDEINMADDAVIERLNSVLELERTLLLSEKGSVASSGNPDVVVATAEFRVLATMNPAGDFGKRELSPALRNRFTEVWIPQPVAIDDYSPIIDRRLGVLFGQSEGESLYSARDVLYKFLEGVLPGSVADVAERRNVTKSGSEPLCDFRLSVRDLTAWCEFIRGAVGSLGLDPLLAVVHGARLVFLDGLSVGSTNQRGCETELEIWKRLLSLLPAAFLAEAKRSRYDDATCIPFSRNSGSNMVCLRVDCFTVHRKKEVGGSRSCKRSSYSFEAPNTMRNTARLARAMSVGSRPILLEGPPGCGKSSLVAALAELSGVFFVRVNLSESTEMSDLIGSDAPGENQGSFTFRSGPLLQALRDGSWLLLDELNLASQSVLEGLNSLLDHRKMLFVPEINEEVIANPSFRVFGAQNPAVDGGGRRGLPKSFLNRFTRVQIEAPAGRDVLVIVQSMHPLIPKEVIAKIVQTLQEFKKRMEASGSRVGGLALRDTLRWCDLLSRMGCNLYDSARSRSFSPACIGAFFDVAILQGLRDSEERSSAELAFEKVFGYPWGRRERIPSVGLSDGGDLRIGLALLRNSGDFLPVSNVEAAHNVLLPTRCRTLQALSFGIQANWPIVLSPGAPSVSQEEGLRLVWQLAMLWGKSIHVIHGGSLTDGADFVGGYVQEDAMRTMRLIARECEEAAHETIHFALQSCSSANPRPLVECMREVLKLLGDMRATVHTPGKDPSADVVNMFLMLARNFTDRIQSAGKCSAVLQKRLMVISRDQEELERLSRSWSNGEVAGFKWRKSEMVTAIEEGKWIFVQEADACPAAVLDRLNPLFERSPVSVATDTSISLEVSPSPMLLAEAPSHEDGSSVFMVPHPEFRMFFAVSSPFENHKSNGLSKAFLDRSLRICMETDLTVPDQNAVAASSGLSGLLSSPRSVVHEDLTYPNNRDFHMTSADIRLSRAQALDKSLSAVVGFAGGTSHDMLEGVGGQYKETAWTTAGHLVCDTQTSMIERDLASLRALKRMSDSVLRDQYWEEMRINLQFCSEEGTGEVELRRHEKCCRDLVCEVLLRGAQAVVMASVSGKDLAIRASVLKDRRVGLSPCETFKLLDVATAAEESVNFDVAPDAASAYDRRQPFSSIPIDPLFGLDMFPTLLYSSEWSGLRRRQHTAKRLRFEILALHGLRTTWERTQRFAKQESIFYHAKISFQLGYGSKDAESVPCVLQTCAFDVALVVTGSIPQFCEKLLAEGGWEVLHEREWFNLFDTVKAICEAMMSSNNVMLTSIPALLCDIGFLGEALHKDCERHDLHSLSRVLKRIKTTTDRLRKSITEGEVIWVPQTRRGQELEANLVAAVKCRDRESMSVTEIEAFAKGIVSLGVTSAEQDGALSETLKKLAESIQKNKPGRTSEVLLMDHWSRAAQNVAILRMQEAIVAVLHDGKIERAGSSPNWPAIYRMVMDSMSQLRCIPCIDLLSLVSLQRLLWTTDSSISPTAQRKRAKRVIEYSAKSAIASILTERSVFLHRELQFTETALLKRRKTRTFSATFGASSGMSTAPFWSMLQARCEAVSALVVLIRGANVIEYDGSAAQKLLRSSFQSAMDDADSLLGVWSYDTLDENDRSTPNANQAEAKRRETPILHPLEVADHIDQLTRLKADTTNKVTNALRSLTLNAESDKLMQWRNILLLGKAWLSIGLIRLKCHQISVKECNGVDPALLSYNLGLHAFRSAVTARASMTAYGVVGANRLGGDDQVASALVQRWRYTLDEAKTRLSMANSRYVFRPSDGASFESFEAFVNNVNSTITDRLLRSPILDGLSADILSSHYRSAKEEALHICESCGATAERLQVQGSLAHFRDLSLNLDLGLREVEHGLSYCLRGSESLELFANKRIAKKLHAFLDIVIFPRAAQISPKQPSDIVATCVDTMRDGNALLAAAEYLLDGDEHETGEGRFDISRALCSIALAWKKGVVSTEATEAKRSSLHVLQEASRKDEIPGSDVVQRLEGAEEDDFRHTFNSMGEDLEEQLYGLKSAVQVSDEGRKLEGETDKSGSDGINIDPEKFWILHRRLYPPSAIPTKTCPSVKSRYETVLSLCPHLPSLSSELRPILDETTLTWDVFSSDYISRKFDGLGTTAYPQNRSEQRSGKSRSPFNFYREADPAELLRASVALETMNISVKRIQKEAFEDTGNHPVLAEVSIAIENVATMCRMDTPLSRVVLGIENVLRRADEWNRLFATSATRLDEDLLAVSRIVATWRQMEMKSWPLLLEERVASHQRRATKWILLLYDVVIHEPLFAEDLDPERCRQVIAAIDQFLRSSPCGEFGVRLEVILSLAAHISSLEGTNKRYADILGRSVKGLGGYYGLYLPAVERSISDSKAVVNKELEDFTRLLTWNPSESLGSSQKMTKEKDKYLEYYRLKAAGEKTRRKLHKLCLKVDAILRAPVYEHLQKELSKIGEQGLSPPSADRDEKLRRDESLSKKITTSLGSLCDSLCKPAPRTCARESILESDWGRELLSRLPSLEKKMMGFGDAINKHGAEQCDLGSNFATNLRHAICSRIEQLRNSENSDVQVKKRSLVDLFKALRRAGLSPFESATRMDPKRWLSSPEPTFCNEYNAVANELFLRGAQHIQRLRDVSDSRVRSADITAAEASKARAFCQDLFDQACSQRSALREFFQDFQELSLEADALMGIQLRTETSMLPKWDVERFRKLQNIVSKLRRISVDIEVCESVILGAENKLRTMPVGHRRGGDPAAVLQMHHQTASQESLKSLCDVFQQCAIALKEAVRESEVLTPFENERKRTVSVLDGTLPEQCFKVKKSLSTLVLTLQKQQLKAVSVSRHNMAVEVLKPVVAFLRWSLEELEAEGLSPDAELSQELDGTWEELKLLAESLVERMLISSQHVISWNDIDAHSLGKNSSYEVVPDVVQNQSGLMKNSSMKVLSLTSSLKLSELLSLLSRNAALLKSVSETQSSPRKLRDILNLQRSLGRILGTFLSRMVTPCARKSANFHCRELAVLRTISSAFVRLCTEGYCRPAQQDEAMEGDEVEGKYGTGFGEAGTGDMSAAQNVSHQIDDEEQLLGLNDEGPAYAENPEEQRDSDENAFEMSTNFDGDMQDVNRPSSEEEPDEYEDGEHEMAPESGVGEDIVDSRMWNDSDKPVGDSTSDGRDEVQNKNRETPGGASDVVAKKGEEREIDSTPSIQNKDKARELTENPDGMEDYSSETEKKEEGSVTESEGATASTKRQEDPLNDKPGESESGADPTDDRRPVDAEKIDDAMDVDRSENGEGPTNPEENHVATKDDVDGRDTAPQESHENVEPEEKQVDGADNDGYKEHDAEDEAMFGMGESLRDNGKERREHEEDGEMDSIPDELPIDELGSISDDDAASSGRKETEGEDDHVEGGQDTKHPGSDGVDRHTACDNGDIGSDEPAETERGPRGVPFVDSQHHPRTHEIELQGGTITSGLRDKKTQESVGVPGFYDPNASENNPGIATEANESRREAGSTAIGALPKGQHNSEEQERADQEAFQFGQHMQNPETRRESGPALDPNPLRSTPVEDLVRTWERYLHVIESERDRITNDASQDQNGKEGLWEFETEEGNETIMHTLGAATDDQHRPLPNGQDSGMENDAPAEDSKPPADKHEVGQSLPHVAEKQEADADSEMPDGDVCAINGKEGETAQIKRIAHPAERAAEDSEQFARGRENRDSRAWRGRGNNEARNETDPDDTEEIQDVEAHEEKLNWVMDNLDDRKAAYHWRKLDAKVSTDASGLCEQLRLVLEPTLASGLTGGYRTGKRLNMRKVIEYVASDFQKDRIWLRRARRDKRSYDVLLAIDDSASMVESAAGVMAIESLVLLMSALSKLEIGRVGVARFGTEAQMLRGFDEPLPMSVESGSKLLQRFSFSQKETNVVNLLKFVQAEMSVLSAAGDAEHISLAFVISDGRLSSREEVQREVRLLKDSGVLVAFLIVDQVHAEQASIYEVRRVEYDENGKVTIMPYMQDFPIDFYAVLQDVRALPTILADALRQWVEVTRARV